MCIRDRQYLLPKLALTRLMGRLAGVRAGGLTTLAIRAFICLLYTSDAADERSSVDLGGRRIIKKKNNCKYRKAPVARNKITLSAYSEHTLHQCLRPRENRAAT